MSKIVPEEEELAILEAADGFRVSGGKRLP